MGSFPRAPYLNTLMVSVIGDEENCSLFTWFKDARVSIHDTLTSVIDFHVDIFQKLEIIKFVSLAYNSEKPCSSSGPGFRCCISM
jgi:hypothetical protein